MAENGFFKTVFRGFKKEDVLDYIESLHTTHCEEVNSLQEELTALRSEKDALENEAVSLRERAAQTDAAQAALQDATARLDAANEQTAALRQKVADAEIRLQECARLKDENVLLQGQLQLQQGELDAFKKMFGDSRDAVAFVKKNVHARMDDSRKQTERALSEVEQVTAQISAELEKLRVRTAAIHNDAIAAHEKDAAALAEWFHQFDSRVSKDTERHFFR